MGNEVLVQVLLTGFCLSLIQQESEISFHQLFTVTAYKIIDVM